MFKRCCGSDKRILWIFNRASSSSSSQALESVSSIEDIAEIVRSCGIARDVEAGKKIHDYIVRYGGAQQKYLQNLLVQMYGRCGCVNEAFAIFNRIHRPNKFSWNILFQVYVENGLLEAARTTFENMPERNAVSWNAMITAYAQNGHLLQAVSLFNKMSDRSVVSWNCMVTAHIQKGELDRAQEFYRKMPEHNAVSGTAMLAVYGQEGQLAEAKMIFDRTSERDVMVWTVMLRAYGQEGALEDAKLAFEKMPAWSIVSWTSLLVLYADRGCFAEARAMFEIMPEHHLVSHSCMMKIHGTNGFAVETKQMFDRLPERDNKSWNVLLTAFAGNGLLQEARAAFDRMPEWSGVSFAALMQACAGTDNGDTEELRRLFDVIPEPDVVCCTTILRAFARNGRVGEAKAVFDRMPEHDTFSWNTMLSAFVEGGELAEARSWFERTPRKNEFSWSVMIEAASHVFGDEDLAGILFRNMPQWDLNSSRAMLAALVANGDVQKAKRLVDEMADRGAELWDSLFMVYAENGYLQEAESLFGQMNERNLITWTALLAARVFKGQKQKEAKCLFDRMPGFDTVACNAMLGACDVEDEAKDLFNEMFQRDVSSWNSLIRGEFAKVVFDKTPQWDMVSFSSMIQAYARNDSFEAARVMFLGIPEWSSALCTFMIVRLMQKGRLLEAREIFDKAPERHSVAWAAILGYVQNGSINDAKILFHEILTHPHVLLWNVMVAADAQNGHAGVALKTVQLLELHGVKPNEATFTTVLAACSRAGLIEQGWERFLAMVGDYGLSPSKIHFRVMVDVLCRMGKLEEAKSLVNNMPYSPDVVVWRTLLAACKVHQDVETGKVAAECMADMDSESSSPYVMLSSLYREAVSGFERWSGMSLQ